MIWAYLYNSLISTPSLISNPLTLECIEIKSSDNNFFDELKEEYVKLLKNGFFNEFIHDYDTLFISTFSPDNYPILSERIFEIKLNNKNK